MIKSLNGYFNGLNVRQCLFVTLMGSLLLGVLDYHTGSELSFSVFYTAPIILAGWYGGRKAGLTIAIFSAGIWLFADVSAGYQYSTVLIPIWNTLVRLIFFLIILWLLIIVREKLILEEILADTDPLTGLSNRRVFQEQLDHECARVSRYPEPFTIAYFDLDNFKYVNDTLGHDIGDELLKTVAHILLTNIREPDLSARLGGDEFAVLFPALKTDDALTVLTNLKNELLEAMISNNWPVTFSIGVITFNTVMTSSREMMKRVDDLMYEVKKSGKNNIRHVVWPE